jgi:hypothetical protein
MSVLLPSSTEPAVVKRRRDDSVASTMPEMGDGRWEMGLDIRE